MDLHKNMFCRLEGFRAGNPRAGPTGRPPEPSYEAAKLEQKNLDLKGASHKTEMGRIWYQKNDLEKLEAQGVLRSLKNA